MCISWLFTLIVFFIFFILVIPLWRIRNFILNYKYIYISMHAPTLHAQLNANVSAINDKIFVNTSYWIRQQILVTACLLFSICIVSIKLQYLMYTQAESKDVKNKLAKTLIQGITVAKHGLLLKIAIHDTVNSKKKT